MAIRSTTRTHEVVASTTIDDCRWTCAAAVRMSPFGGGVPLVRDMTGFECWSADGEALIERFVELDPLQYGAVLDALELNAIAQYLAETQGDDSLLEALADRLLDHQRDLHPSELN